MKTGCYIATNTINGKQYVGKVVSYFCNRKASHKWAYNHENPKYRNTCKQFYRALRKYGWDAFEWKFYYCPKELLVAFERGLIAACDSYKNGYNATEGGEGAMGRVISDETREKMRNAQKGRKQSPERRVKSGNAFRGKKHTPEAKEKIRQAKLGKKTFARDKTIKLVNAMKGVKHTEGRRMARVGKKLGPYKKREGCGKLFR